MADLAKPLRTKELAEKHGVHRTTAWRLLRRLNGKTGRVILGESGSGRPIVTTLHAIREADDRYVETKSLEREDIEREVTKRYGARLVALEKKLADGEDARKALELRLRVQADTLLQLFRALQLVTKRSDGSGSGRGAAQSQAADDDEDPGARDSG